MSGVMSPDHDDLTYGCEESIPGNCPCEDDNCENDPHLYEHVCTLDEFHVGPHGCCCGRIWPNPAAAAGVFSEGATND